MYEVTLAKTQNEINGIIDLRYDILRKPWNQPKETATDGMEDKAINAYIEDNDKVLACGRLQDNGRGIGQISSIVFKFIFFASSSSFVTINFPKPFP